MKSFIIVAAVAGAAVTAGLPASAEAHQNGGLW